MKRPKLFLGLTSVALAIAAIVAAKSMQPIRNAYYLTKGAAHNCLFLNLAVCPTNGIAPNQTCKVLIEGTAPANIYTMSQSTTQLNEQLRFSIQHQNKII